MICTATQSLLKVIECWSPVTHYLRSILDSPQAIKESLVMALQIPKQKQQLQLTATLVG